MPDPHPHEPLPLAHDLVQALVRYADAMEIMHVVEHGAAVPSRHVATVRALIDRIHRTVPRSSHVAPHVTPHVAPRFTSHDVALLTGIGNGLVVDASPAGDRRRRGLLPATAWSRTLGGELLQLRDHLQRHVAGATPSAAAVRCGDHPPTPEE